METTEPTPAEKEAKELIEQFMPYAKDMEFGMSESEAQLKNAKQCALRCADYWWDAVNGQFQADDSHASLSSDAWNNLWWQYQSLKTAIENYGTEK